MWEERNFQAPGGLCIFGKGCLDRKCWMWRQAKWVLLGRWNSSFRCSQVLGLALEKKSCILFRLFNLSGFVYKKGTMVSMAWIDSVVNVIRVRFLGSLSRNCPCLYGCCHWRGKGRCVSQPPGVKKSVKR